jgi:hypothetical protein
MIPLRTYRRAASLLACCALCRWPLASRTSATSSRTSARSWTISSGTSATASRPSRSASRCLPAADAEAAIAVRDKACAWVPSAGAASALRSARSATSAGCPSRRRSSASRAAAWEIWLYDLDRIISRTVAYGLLTLLLGGGYAGIVLGLGQLLGQGSSLVVAAATLAVAAVIQPARRRIQALVDRRFNRRHYDAAKTVEAFSARLRRQIELDTLSAELLAVVDQTVEPTTRSLWLRPPGTALGRQYRHLIGVAGAVRPSRAGLLGAAPQDQHLGQLGQRLGEVGGGGFGDAGGRPADRLEVGHVQAELAGEGGVAMLLRRSSYGDQAQSMLRPHRPRGAA